MFQVTEKAVEMITEILKDRSIDLITIRLRVNEGG